MSPENVADKLRVLAALAPMVPGSPTATKLYNELARELRPVMPTVIRGLVCFMLIDTIVTGLKKPGNPLERYFAGAPSTGDTHKSSVTE
ncbi:hypothetical protein [Actinomadura coerulea]|uniref:hypothetical protein n=1 Tax=Actinomadura coerulea TaxID=46159 RepID=UPI00342E1FCB